MHRVSEMGGKGGEKTGGQMRVETKETTDGFHLVLQSGLTWRDARMVSDLKGQHFETSSLTPACCCPIL